MKQSILSTITQWIITAIALALSIINLSGGTLFIGIGMLIGTALICPFTPKINTFRLKPKLITLGILMVLSWTCEGIMQLKQIETQNKIKQAKALEEQRIADSIFVADFNTNKPNILITLDSCINASDLKSVRTLLKKYKSIKDNDMRSYVTKIKNKQNEIRTKDLNHILRTQCNSASLIYKKNIYTELLKLNSSNTSYKKSLDYINKQIDKQNKIKQAKAQRELRIKTQTTLRNSYLNSGADIKVKVHGKNKDRITLTYVLFNDVWAHKMSKTDMLDNLQKLGFKRVTLSDNYKYKVYWTFK